MLMLERKKIRMLLVIWLVLSACGYRFSGGGSLPEGIRSIRVNMFKNRTAETGLENIVTNDLIYEFTRVQKVVLDAGDRADATLDGVITSVLTRTSSRKGQQTSQERRIKVSVDLKLTGSEGRLVWSAKGVSDNQSYVVAPDKISTEQNRQEAIVKLSRRLAEKIYARLTADF